MTAITIGVLTVDAAAVGENVAAHIGEGGGLVGLFFKGGPFMWPILICSIVGLAFVFERIVSLRRGAIYPTRQVKAIREQVLSGDTEAAIAACEEASTPFSRVLHACLVRSDTEGFEMEAALEEAGARALYDMRRGGRPLGIIADVSPLLGLLGTVTGMIKAFEVVAQEGALGKPELLAEGISEALLTTAFGLCVAVPALLFFQYFRSRSEGWVRIIEDTCLDLLVKLRRGRKQANAT